MFRYPIIKLNKPPLNMDTNYNYGQGVGILFNRSVKFSMFLSTGDTPAFESVLCYEVFKKWPLLSPSPDRIR